MDKVDIKTERLYIRNITLNDVDDVYLSWLNDYESTKYIVHRKNSIDSLKKYVKEKIDNPNTIFLAIFDLLSNKHIGNIKFEPIDLAERFAVMGILIGDSNYKGIGIAKEVIINTSFYLNRSLNINKIYLGVNTNNLPALKAYTKMGFRQSITNKVFAKSINSKIFELEISRN